MRATRRIEAAGVRRGASRGWEEDGRPTSDGSEAAALRLVLGLVLSRQETATMLARRLGAAVDGLWPSVVVAGLADAFIAEPGRWPEVRATLDRRLAPWLAELAYRPLFEVLSRLPREEEGLDIAGLAALLWSLVRDRQPALGAVLARVVGEAERLIVADAGRRGRALDLPTMRPGVRRG